MNEVETPLYLNEHKVTIRPIDMGDISMEMDFIRKLSTETKHFRFFEALKELPRPEVARLCTVDGFKSMAYVATIKEGDCELEIGVVRYAPGCNPSSREFAITIADQWQGTELASRLMRRLIETAKRHGVHDLYAVELSENRFMHELARTFGMRTEPEPSDRTQVTYRLTV
jgi:acetyltransferase